MDDRTTQNALSLTKFGIGQPVPRSEDPTLVRGQGCYTDDLSRAGEAFAVMVRSREAHGVIRSIDTNAAKAMPGVLAVYTAADLSAYGPLKCNLPLKSRDGASIRYTPRQALAADKVRFVGDPLACVVAETIAQAKDAAEAVTVDIEPLKPVLTAADAVKPGAPLVFDNVPNNIALDFYYGDAAKVAEAFAKAKHVTRLETSNQRMVVNAMEPRAAIGEYEAGTGKWTLYSSSQGVHGMKTSLMDILSAPADMLGKRRYGARVASFELGERLQIAFRRRGFVLFAPEGLEGTQRLRPSAQHKVAYRPALEIHHPRGKGCANANTGPKLFVGGFQPRRNIDGITVGGVVEEAATTEIADNCGPGMSTNTRNPQGDPFFIPAPAK